MFFGPRRRKPLSQLRVLYMAGPGNVGRSLAAHATGHLNPDIGHAGYSDQLFRVCQELGAEVLAVCTNESVTDAQVGPIRLKHLADPLSGRRSVHYEWSHVRLAKTVTQLAGEFRANVVVTPFEPYPFLLEPLWRSGINVVLALHCTLWPVFKPRSAKWRAFAPLLRRAFNQGVAAILSASDAVTTQVEQIAGADCPVVEFMPTFRAEAFPLLPDPPGGKPFRVMFVGRCERDKGVFTLIEVARLLRERGRQDVVFDICGDGSALSELRASVAQHQLEAIFQLHGWCLADRLVELSRGAHAFVVPTTTEFNEGFNHVVVEGLLAGRPVITSPVCPAAGYVRSAITLVKPDDPSSYLEAILSLADDPLRYQRQRVASRSASERFFDPSWGFATGLKAVLTAIARGEQPQPRHIDPSFGLSQD